MTTHKTGLSRLEKIEKSCRVIPDFVRLSASETPLKTAYRQYDRQSSEWKSLSYADLVQGIDKWRKVLVSLGLRRGDRVAILLGNSIDAVMADQAVLANALVPVPMHAIDTPRSSAFIMDDSQARLFITNKTDRWESIERAGIALKHLEHILVTDDEILSGNSTPAMHRLSDCFSESENIQNLPEGPTPDDLGAIVYTSGTTGNPKGVMLTHRNVVANVLACLRTIDPLPREHFEFLSFLPLSHTFERTAGYYMPLAASCTIWFNRSIMMLNEDLKLVRPHFFISVPRIYERVYIKILESLKQQSALKRFLFWSCVNVGWRMHCRKNGLPVESSPLGWLDAFLCPILQKLVATKLLAAFGGRMALAVAGGAALSAPVARCFLGLGLPLIQGYGMTECSPVVSVNRLTHNDPKTVGEPLIGVDVRLDEQTKEIQIRGDTVMKGYWNRPEATAEVFDGDWLKTGDVGTFDESGCFQIRGRIKEIIVTSTGEKVPPVDLETALQADPLFTQVYVLGEDRPYITFVAVLNRKEWIPIAERFGVNPNDPKSYQVPVVRAAVMRRAKAAAAGFPHYALPRNGVITFEPWTVENGFLTPTLKLKRKPIYEHFKADIDAMYAMHG